MSGQPQTAAELSASRLPGRLVPQDLWGTAWALALEPAQAGAPLPRARYRSVDAAAAKVNEAALLLSEGAAHRTGDIDADRHPLRLRQPSR